MTPNDNMKNRERSLANSKIKRDVVLGMIRDALTYNGTDEGIGRSHAALKQAAAYMKDGWQKVAEELFSPFTGDGYMTKEDRDYCWQELQSAWDKIKYRQNELKGNNYYLIKERLNRISDLAVNFDPHEALNEIKAANQAMKGLRMEDWQYKEIRNSLDYYWNKAIDRIKEKGAGKREKWQGDMRDKISRLSQVVDKMSNFVEHQRSHRNKLTDMKYEAKSSEYRDRVDGWIDEVDSKISDALRSISEIEDKIRDIRRKLDN